MDDQAARIVELERQVFDYAQREKAWNTSALMESHGRWAEEARKTWAENVRLRHVVNLASAREYVDPNHGRLCSCPLGLALAALDA